MNVPEPNDTQTYLSDGVEVSKWLDESLFSFPSIAYQLASSREDPVTVRLVESVPDGIDPEEFGFHPSYGSEYWHADDDTITFEYTLRPTGGFITVCGVRSGDNERIEELLAEPEELSVHPPGESVEATIDAAHAESGESAEATRTSQVATACGGVEVECIEETDDEVTDEPSPTGPDSDAVEADDVDEDTDGDVSGAEREDERRGECEKESAVLYRKAATPAQSGTGDATADDEVDVESAEPSAEVEQDLTDFVRAVQDGEVSEEDVRVLREIFVSEMLGSESVQTRLRHLQGQVADLKAYTSALEQFIDENGDGEQIIERHQAQVEAVQDELAELREGFEEHDDTIASLSGDVETLETGHERLGDELEGLSEELSGELSEMRDDLESLDSTVADIDERVPDGDFAARFDEFEREIVELRNWKENMRKIFSRTGESGR